MDNLIKKPIKPQASSRRFVLWAALALVLAGLGSVKADTISYYATAGAGDLELLVPQFDPALGQLTDVSIQFSISVGNQFLVYNNTSDDTPFTISASAIGSMSAGILGASGEQTQNFDGFAAANVYTVVNGGITVSGSADTSLAADLATFTGTDMVYGGGGGSRGTVSIVPSSLDINVIYSGFGGGYGVMTYTYNPVPEPRALTLLVGGLPLLSLRCKRESHPFSPTT